MGIQWKYRSKQSGEPLAKITVSYYIQKEDLVTAALSVLLDSDGAAALTKASIEGRLRELVEDRGQAFFEFGLDRALVVDLAQERAFRERAEDAVAELF